MKEPGRVNVFEVLGEALHYHSLADTDTALEHDMLVQLIATLRENLLGQLAVVEVVEQKADNLLVMLINNESAVLRFNDNYVGDVQEQPGVQLIYGRVGKVGELLAFLFLILIRLFDDIAYLHSRNDRIVTCPALHAVKYTLVPIQVASRLLTVFGEFVNEAGRVFLKRSNHCASFLYIHATEATLESVVGGRERRVIVI